MKYFIYEVVTGPSNNRATDDTISTKMFEDFERKTGRRHTAARFRPTAERLIDIADNGQKLLKNAADKGLTEFTE